jgi:TPR repeat protein
MAGRDGTVGMLGTTGSNRPSFFVHLFRLYKSDTTFRALTDFTVMGAVVLLFLHPGVKDLFKSSPSGGTSQTAAKGPSAPPSPAQTAPASQTSTPQAPPTVVTRSGPAIQFPQEVNVPSLGNYVIVDIDESAFRSSPASDQPRLAAAARAARSQQFAEAINQLRDANAADRNVAFMRGLALMNTGKAAEAEPALRTASGAGQRQASILLGRLLITAPSGVTKNVAEGRRLIETAADAGDRLGRRLAAIGYITGEFGAFDPIKARDLLRQASQGGDAPAMLFYAHMLDGGLGGPADLDGAVDLLRRAAAAGLTSAQEILGSWLLAQWRAKTLADPREVAEWLERAYKPGQSPRAAALLAVLLGDNAAPANVQNKAKAYELLRLCSGLRHALCQINNAWVLRFGIGVGRDLVRAYAHADIARQLNHADGPKVLSALDTQLSEADKARAAQLIRTIQTSLKPIPPPWHMQYVGVAPPPEQWAVAPGAPEPATATAASPASQAPPAAAPAPAAPRPPAPQPAAAPPAPPQVVTAPDTPTVTPGTSQSAALVPVATIKRIAYRGGTGQNVVAGSFTREGNNVWVESNSSGRAFRFISVTETDKEILLLDSSRDMQLWIDFTQRKWFFRQSIADGWRGGTDILATVSDATTPGVTRAIDQDADRVGEDYVGYNMANLQPDFCQQSCIDDRQCRAWTYVRPGTQGPQARCFLKKQVPALTQANCCVSGVVRP